MRRLRRCVLLLAAAALAVQLVQLAQTAVKKVSPFGLMVEKGDIRLVVDTETARYQGKKAYIPMVVFVGALGAESLTLNRGAFTLTDPSGKVSPMATLEAIQERSNYGSFSVADDYTFIHRTIEAGPDTQAFNGLGFQQGTCFFPNVSGLPAMVRDDVQLRPNAWTWALMYFANPAGKAKGIYTLTYTDPATKGVVSVPFTIDWK